MTDDRANSQRSATYRRRLARNVIIRGKKPLRISLSLSLSTVPFRSRARRIIYSRTTDCLRILFFVRVAFLRRRFYDWRDLLLSAAVCLCVSLLLLCPRSNYCPGGLWLARETGRQARQIPGVETRPVHQSRGDNSQSLLYEISRPCLSTVSTYVCTYVRAHVHVCAVMYTRAVL